MADHLSVSVVIATLGRPATLMRAISSAVESQPAPLEVLVVDGDAQGTAESAVREAATGRPVPVRYILADRGLTRQRNVGLREARGQIVLFIDDDARVAGGTLRAVLDTYADTSVAGVTGRVIEPASNRVGGKSSPVRRLLLGGERQGTFTRFGYPHRLVDENVDRDVEFMAGCFMSARRMVALELGFDELLVGYGLAEDEDFSYRLSRLGRIRYTANAVVFHDNTGFGSRDRRAFGRLVVRNRWYLFRKNFKQTRTAQMQFGFFLGVLLVHRLLNRDLIGAYGLAEGVFALIARARTTAPRDS